MALTILPNAGQTLVETRDPIRINFQNIENGFIQDHVDYATANAGKHTAVHFVNQQVAPNAPVTVGGECAIYAAPSILGAANPPALFFKGQNSAANLNGIDFTTCGAANPGWTRLPSGIIIVWGNTNLTGTFATPQTVAFPANANTPVFTNVFTVQLTLGPSTGGDTNLCIFLTGFTNLNFTAAIAKISGSLPVTAPVYYLALGN